MIALTTDPLDVGAVHAAVGASAHGGVASFVGVTRPDGDTVALNYEAHEALALHEMQAIAAEVSARYDARVAVVHRLGRVAVGEASVVVAASAAHRAEAFSACRALIDELKRRAPIWKQEIRADGSTAWRDARQAPTS